MNDKKGKKKLKQSLVYMLILAVLLIFGIGVGYWSAAVIIPKGFGTDHSIVVNIVLLNIYILLSWMIQIILHETGHLIGGLLTGYEFVSFRILKYCIVRKNGKLKLTYLSIPGTQGQCLLLPPKDYNTTKAPFHIYNLGGVAMNLLSFIISLLLIYLFDINLYLDVFLKFNALISIVIFLLNVIPIKAGITNDGYNSFILGNNLNNRNTLFRVLDMNAQLSNGVKFKDIDESVFSVKSVYPEMSCIELSLYLNYLLYKVDKYGDINEYCEAICNLNTENLKIPTAIKNEIDSEKLFSLYLNSGDEEEIESLNTKQLKAYIKATQKFMVNKKRMLYVKALCYDKNIDEARKVYDEAVKMRDSYYSEGEYNTEMALLDKLRDNLTQIKAE